MKNLKKIAALVVVLAMALSSVAFAAAFSDVSEDASYNEAVQVMAALGLLKGDPEGTFRPDATITRAEFAAVVVRALGMEDAAKGASVNTIFTDVPADHWASGYVQIANQQNIILGYGDGNFGPDDEVLYEQAVKMIVCALNYGVKFVNVPDAYPTSYLAQANADGITVGASGKIGDKASRAVVARMVYNALDVAMMNQTTIGGNNGDEFQVENNRTLLTSKLKIAKVEGTVDQLFFNKDQSDEIRFTITKEDTKWNNFNDSNDLLVDTAENLVYGEDVDVASMKGYSCVAYIDMSDDSDMVLKAIAPKAGRNKTLTLTKKQVESANVGKGEISYYKNDSNDEKSLKIKLADDFAIYENLSTDNLAASSDGIDSFEALFEDKTIDFTAIKLIENDNDNRYDVAIVEKYGSFVVDSVNERNYTIYGNASAEVTFDGYKVVLDPDNDLISYSLKDKDGKEIALTDIKKDNVANIAVSTDGSDKFYDIIITDTIVTGVVNEAMESNGITYYKIDGNEYKVANNVDDLVAVSDEGTFIIDMSGNILYKTDAVSGAASDFGFLVAVEAKPEFNNYTYKASLMNNKGEFSTLEFANKIRLNGAAQKEIGKDGGIDWDTQIKALESNLVGYKTNSSGQISQLFTTDTEANVQTMNKDYSLAKSKSLNYKGDGQLGSYFVDENTNIFNADVESEAAIKGVKKEDLSIVKASALQEDKAYGFKTIISDADGNIVAILGYDITAVASPDSPAMFVTNFGTKNDSVGDPATLLTGYVEGELVSILLTDDTKIENNTGIQVENSEGVKVDKEFARDEIKKGFVIQYSANSNGEASGVSVLLTKDQVIGKTAIANDDPATQDEDLFVYADSVYEVGSSRVLFRTKDGDDANISVSMKGSVPTIKVIKNSDGSDIRTIQADAMMKDVETDKRNPGNIAANEDKLIVVKYDNTSIIAIVVTK